jgi:hypothetical protein
LLYWYIDRIILIITRSGYSNEGIDRVGNPRVGNPVGKKPLTCLSMP